MFGYIKGTLAEIDEGAVTIDVQGIGIQILVGAGLIGAKRNQTVTITIPAGTLRYKVTSIKKMN